MFRQRFNLTIQAALNVTILATIIAVFYIAAGMNALSLGTYEAVAIATVIFRSTAYGVTWSVPDSVPGGFFKNGWLETCAHAGIAMLSIEWAAFSSVHLLFACLWAGIGVGTIAGHTARQLCDRQRSWRVLEFALHFILTAVTALLTVRFFATGYAGRMLDAPLAEAWRILLPVGLLIAQIFWALTLDYRRQLAAARAEQAPVASNVSTLKHG